MDGAAHRLGSGAAPCRQGRTTGGDQQHDDQGGNNAKLLSPSAGFAVYGGTLSAQMGLGLIAGAVHVRLSGSVHREPRVFLHIFPIGVADSTVMSPCPSQIRATITFPIKTRLPNTATIFGPGACIAYITVSVPGHS